MTRTPGLQYNQSGTIGILEVVDITIVALLIRFRGQRLEHRFDDRQPARAPGSPDINVLTRRVAQQAKHQGFTRRILTDDLAGRIHRFRGFKIQNLFVAMPAQIRRRKFEVFHFRT